MEDLAYRRMLDQYYLRECPLPEDPAEVARLIRLRSHVAEVQAVLSEFFTLTADGWAHARCEAELSRMQDKQAKAKASAQASVNARIAKQASGRSTNAERTLNERSTDVELPTPTPTPTPEEKDKDTAQAPSSRKRAVCVSADDMAAEGVDPVHARDWLQVRKTKDLPLTPTAWTSTKVEALKAGLTPAQAVQMAAENGWGGFKAVWIEQSKTPIPARPGAKPSRHSGFDSKDYHQGVTEDGRF